jgi:hypothetical protein
MTVLWTAVNVSAVAEAARRIDHLVQNAPAAYVFYRFVKSLFAVQA